MDFTELIDLASEKLGGAVLFANDDFFAPKENLLKASAPVWRESEYTDRGKWMDGWESRRKRVPGHDYCILRLGVPGEILAFDIDTRHFVGNHPAFASVDGLLTDADAPLERLLQQPFHELLAQAPLLPNSSNLFVAAHVGVVSHVRLNIFPDGGVARFRCYGRVSPSWQEPRFDAETRDQVPAGSYDLAALENGALALACSDAHFGGMNNLLLPGRAENMGSGWETRRRRGPGDDWILIQLAARGAPRVIEVDTRHFKGNFPDRCAIEGVDAAGARPTDLIARTDFRLLLPETKLSADHRHFFTLEASARAPITHLRLRIFPDGGVSRLRCWGDRHG
jgi:allantoicase